MHEPFLMGQEQENGDDKENRMETTRSIDKENCPRENGDAEDQDAKVDTARCPSAQLFASVMRRCRTKAEGDELFSRLRGADSAAALAELGVPPASCGAPAALDEAYGRCAALWAKTASQDVAFIVNYVKTECATMMEADNRFRSLQGRVGRRLSGRGVLTEDVLASSRVQCQEYWSRVTPGNVALITNNVAGKCSEWTAAEKKFDWLWKNGNFSEDGRCVTVAGRLLTLEDLEEAERRCRKKFSLPASFSRNLESMKSKAAAVASAAPAVPIIPPVAETDAALTPAVESASLAVDAGGETPSVPSGNMVDTAELAAPDNTSIATPLPVATLPTSMALAAPASKRGVPAKVQVSNTDFIVEHILKKCTEAEGSKKFFSWLRASKNNKIRGREFCPEDIDAAEQRCRETWERRARADKAKADIVKEARRAEQAAARAEKAKAKAEAADSEVSGRALADAGDPSIGNADFIVKHVLASYSNMDGAQRCFDRLNTTIGEMSTLGRVFSEEEVTEAFLQCSGDFEEREAEETRQEEQEAKEADDREERRAQKRREAGKSETMGAGEKGSNVEVIVRAVVRKYDDMIKAEKCFAMLHRTIGQANPLGRVFSEEDVTEGWLRCSAFFEQQGESSSDSSGSSDSSDSSLPVQRAKGRPKVSKTKDGAKKEKKEKKQKKGKKKKKLVDEELEGALFGSDSDDLSGEEDVDEEDDDQADFAARLSAADFDEQVVDDSQYPHEVWGELTPEVGVGLEGFNLRATAAMRAAKIGDRKLEVQFDSKAACPPLQPHQEAVAFLLHPKSPIGRLLVDHPTGSGKTREMIRVLDNFFYDPRAKVPIFPKDPVCRNFYAELLRWPSRYRDYFCCMRPADAAIASGNPSWKNLRWHMWDLGNFAEEEVRRLGYSIREVLEMKSMFRQGRLKKEHRVEFSRKHPGEPMPGGPLRALGYTSAGGMFSKIAPGGQPLSALMKIGFVAGSTNVYSNKVVLMDEAHNLVRTQTQYAEQLHRLRDLLFTGKNLVLAGFTGTPILNEPTEGRQLLDIIKGIEAPEGDEGSLSSFPMRPQPLFPLSLPRGIPDAVLTAQRKKHLVKKVEIHGETLKIYDWKRRVGVPARRLRAYCNVCTFHGSFHDGAHGTKAKIMTFPEDCCPKLFAIAQAVASSPEKAIVMTSRQNGYVVMLELMRFVASKADPPFSVASMDELSEFNHVSNIRGEKMRVLVADANQCSEGVSFFAVRRTFLSDVPVSPSQFIQQCGRAIRMYGHRGLPEEEQTVTTQLYVSTFPKWMRTSLACWSLRAQKKHGSGKEVEKRARVLTARLNRAGIRTLSALKTRIDAHGEEKRDGLYGDDKRELKINLTSEDIVGFFEQNGLWEEARSLRTADKKEKEVLTEKGLKQEALTLAIEQSQVGVDANDAETAPGVGPVLGRMMSRMGSVDALENLGRTLTRVDSANSLDGDAADAEGDTLAEDALPGDQEDTGAMDDFEAALESVIEEVSGKPTAGDVAPADIAAPQTSGLSQSEAQDVAAVATTVGTAEALPIDGIACDAIATEQPAPASADALDLKTAGNGQPVNSTAHFSAVPLLVMPKGPSEVELALKEALRLVSDACEQIKVRDAEAKVAPPEVTEGVAAESASADMDACAAFESALGDALGDVLGDAEAATGTAAVTEFGASVEVPMAPVIDSDILAADDDMPAAQVEAEAEVEAGAEPGVAAPTAPIVLAPGQRFQPKAEEKAIDEEKSTAQEHSNDNPQPEETWVTKLREDLAALHSIHPVAQAVKLAAPGLAPVGHSAADTDAKVDPTDEPEAIPPVEVHKLTTDQVRALRDELFRKQKTASLKRALAVVKAACHQIPSGENAWKAAVEEGLADLWGKDHLGNAIRLAAPAQDVRSPADLDSQTLVRLHEELAKMKVLDELPPPKPRALVRAMQQLYAADSAEGGTLHLGSETADEEALRQLTERSQEFAPALAAMRSVAVDHEIFLHLADNSDGEGANDVMSESEGSDLEKELVGSMADQQAFVLPPGWRMEWVKRGKREAREFVDPDGRRYPNVAEARRGIRAWDARKAREQGATDAFIAGAATGELSFEDLLSAEMEAALSASNFAPPAVPAPPPKRTRLLGKTSIVAAAPREDLFGGMCEDAPDLERALESTLAELEQERLTCGVPAAVAGPLPPPAAIAARRGARVVLFGLQAKPELNGMAGRLIAPNAETGRWECRMANGTSLNVKPENYTAVPGACSTSEDSPLETPEPADAGVCVLHSLVAKPEINGQIARTLYLNEESGRWACLLSSDERVNVKPANLTPFPEPTVASARPSFTVNEVSGKRGGRRSPAVSAGRATPPALPLVSQSKRPAPPGRPGAREAQKKARGRGGRGVGRGSTVAAEASESD